MERGYVLHSRPYRESSTIVNMLIDSVGRVDAVVRLGSGKRTLKSIIQPFQPLIFSLTGRGELKTLTQVEAMSAAIPLEGKSLYAGMYLNELLIRILPHGGEKLFLEYHHSLMALAREFNEFHLRFLEVKLLQELGAMPSLDCDGNGDPILVDKRYHYVSEQGFWPLAAGAGHVMCWSGESLLRLQQQNLFEQDRLMIKRLMRQLLQPLLGNKPLQSRALFLANDVHASKK